MRLFLHHVPGRLRLRLPPLQGRRKACEAARARAAAIPGVIAARANPHTGSLTMLYDRERVAPESLWHALCAAGLAWGTSPIAAGVAVTRTELRLPLDASPAGELARTLMSLFVEALAQRSAAILLGGLD